MSEIYVFSLKMKKIIENWKYWVEKIAATAKEVLGDCEIYVFGSVAEGTWTGGSDVDILIVCSKRIKSNKERGELKALIEEKACLPLFHPFEIHLVSKKEAKWYWRHIKKYIKVD